MGQIRVDCTEPDCLGYLLLAAVLVAWVFLLVLAATGPTPEERGNLLNEHGHSTHVRWR